VTLSPRERLHRLIAELRAGSLDTESFCSRFETTYNVDLDKQSLTPVEAEAFAELFEIAVWYSPFPDERARIPNYRNEQDIALAVEHAAQRLGERDAGNARITKLEAAVLGAFVAAFRDDARLVPEHLTVESRETDPVGFFTHIERNESAHVFSDNRSLRWGGLGARFGEVGTGFVVFVDGGCLTMIEGYTYGDAWPPGEPDSYFSI